MEAHARTLDANKFVDWCEAQTEHSRSTTSRIIVYNDDQVKYRLREGDDIEDITLIKCDETDIIRFTKNGESRQFMAHKRNFTFHDKTLIVRTRDGHEICRAGTGTRNKKGPFPV